MPCEVSISETALTVENRATGEVQQILFAEIQAYRLDSWQLFLRLQDGSKIQLQVNSKFYKPGSFAEMSRAFERMLRAARGRDTLRLE